MKIIHIIPGFGGTYYCGNCLRDSALVKTLREAGHDAMTLPMYLPLTRSGSGGAASGSGRAASGSGEEASVPVFYGAVSIFLKQNYPWFRRMPGWMERMFNSGPMLRMAARMSGSTRATGLEEMTESMLLGEEGFQREELEQLVAFLKTEKPDVVHLSNALLLGMAGAIRREVGVPVVCTLQDEDVWVDVMRDPYRERTWELMAGHVRHVDGFVAVSRYFGEKMQQRMRIPEEKLFQVHLGIDPGKYRFRLPSEKQPAIGYLSRITENLGFGTLVDAFILLKERPAFASLRLIATGGMTSDDKPFLRRQLKKLAARGFQHDAEILHDFRQDELTGFFGKITLLSVPVPAGEAFGLYQLEALASGVPLVQPAVGAFPEIIEATGGGEVYAPVTAEALAERLAGVLSSPAKLEQYSRNGHRAVTEEFSARSLAGRMEEVYRKITGNRTEQPNNPK